MLSMTACAGYGLAPPCARHPDRGNRVSFAHDVERALDVVVDLVNTDPASIGEELLPDPDCTAGVRRAA